MFSRSHKAGFTLIELLIVVVIIGILAVIAIPKFTDTKGRANAAAMKSDLRNLATAQEAYYYDNSQYAPSLAALNFQPSTGVIITVAEATPVGWSASSTHPQSFPLVCAIYVGGATPLLPALNEGIIRCA